MCDVLLCHACTTGVTDGQADTDGHNYNSLSVRLTPCRENAIKLHTTANNEHKVYIMKHRDDDNLKLQYQDDTSSIKLLGIWHEE